MFFINTHSRSLPGDYDSGTMKSEYMHLLSPIIRPFREKKDEKKNRESISLIQIIWVSEMMNRTEREDRIVTEVIKKKLPRSERQYSRLDQSTK